MAENQPPSRELPITIYQEALGKLAAAQATRNDNAVRQAAKGVDAAVQKVYDRLWENSSS